MKRNLISISVPEKHYHWVEGEMKTKGRREKSAGGILDKSLIEILEVADRGGWIKREMKARRGKK